MDWLIFAGIVVALVALGVLAQKMRWIDLSNRNARGRSGMGGGLASIGDEVFHPAKYESQLELDRQTILPAPAPLPGDGDKDIYRGNVRIDLTHTAPVFTRRGRHRAAVIPDPAVPDPAVPGTASESSGRDSQGAPEGTHSQTGNSR
ncbi:MAG: hypothetical protein JF618_01795 [Leifsonia sp.]|nr:hypothetical protein [Leifsonia sp.]